MLKIGLIEQDVIMGLGEVAVFVGIIAVVVFFLRVSAKRNPEPTLFNCARCGCQSIHTERTLTAWRGNRKPYCNDCHQRWLESNTRQLPLKYKNNAGCLGFLILFAIIPLAYFICKPV